MADAAKIKSVKCAHCLAPLPLSTGKSTVCQYCGHVLIDLPDTWWARPVVVPEWTGRPEDEGKPRVGLGRHSYVLVRQIASGEVSDVFHARRDARLTEQVLMKIARGGSDSEEAKTLTREWATIGRLRGSSARGAEHFSRLLPVPVAQGKLRRVGAPSGVGVAYRYRVGFTHTAADIIASHANRVDARIAVWVYKRLLEMLSWVHSSGFVHRAIRPEHCLIHPTAHGAVLLGWSKARWRHGRSAGDVRPATDLRDTARCITALLSGGRHHLPRKTPSSLADLLSAQIDRPGDDAWAVRAQLVQIAENVFGPARYSPLILK